jgi:zinc protease
VITGDVAPQEAFARAEQFFGDWARGPATFSQQPMVQHPPLPKNEGAVVEAPLSTAMLEIGWIGPSLNQDTRATYAADVFSYIVRQPESRLQRAVVDTGLASSLGFGYFTQRANGPITLTAATTPEKARPLLAALQKEIAHFTDADYFSDQQLENAKMLLAADDLFAREKPSEYADTLSFWLSSAGASYWKTYHTSLSAVSRADISRYLRIYVTGRPHVTLVMFSPEAQKRVQLKSEELAQ